MAENIVNSLFGVDPQALQQQRQILDANQAYRFAQLDPLQQATMSIYQGGAGLGRAATQLLGGDEQMQRATEIRRLSTQFDMTTPDGLRQFAQAVSSFSPEVATQAAKRASDLELTQAKTVKTLRETKTPTSGLGKLITELDQLIADGATESDPRVIAYRKAIAAEGEGKGTKVAVDLSGLTQLFARKEAEASAKDITDQISKAQDQLKTGSKVSRDIAEIEKILPNTFTGQFANFSKTASKTLSALGVPVSDKASNTEVLQALTNNLVLPAVKQLPGSLAAKELAFLQQTKPEALQEPATIKRLLNMIKDDIGVNRILVKRADEYKKADKLGSLQGFNIALQQDSIYQDLRRYNALKATIASGGKITQAQADFAKKFEQEIGME